jgi:hypothetical protein
MSFFEPAESRPDEPHIDRDAARALLAALDRWRPPTRLNQPAKPAAEVLPLREAALALVEDTPEGRALAEKLDAFDDLDDRAKNKAAPGIRKDIADIVARAATEEHQRKALLEALANFRNDQTLPASEPSERREQHPCIPQLLDVVEDMLEALGKEMLIEALLPGAHILLPPTDFVDSVFTAVTMLEIADPATVEIEEPWHWP